MNLNLLRGVGPLAIVFLTTAFHANASPNAPTWRGQSITEFTAAQRGAFEWRIVNDGVMGGLSDGRIEISEEETLRFSGNLSLENNGGFSMVRSRKIPLNLSGDSGFLLNVKGDGRTYQVRTTTNARFRGMDVSFSGEFETTSGEWKQVRVPFKSLEASFRGRDLPREVFSPADIESIAIMIADKQEGPFNLEVDWIRTYGKGQGEFTERSESIREASSDDSNRLIGKIGSDSRLSILKTALDTAGLTPFFQWDNPLTVFAPTNAAFENLPEGQLEELLRPENKQELIAVLSHHVSSGSKTLEGPERPARIDMLREKTVSLDYSEEDIHVGAATIIERGIKCEDGVLHIIDAVLLR